RAARWADLHRARVGYRKGARVLRAGKRAGVVAERTRAAADGRRLSGTAVAHQPDERCRALSAAGDTEPALRRAGPASGRAARGAAQGVRADLGTPCAGPAAGCGLRFAVPGRAVAVRHATGGLLATAR